MESLHFLLVCSEWLPRHGGLPQFNRNLALALRAAGHQVTCLVESISGDDEADAISLDVQLYVPGVAPSLPILALRPPEMDGMHVDVVVGHDRRTGRMAAAQAHYNFKGSVFVEIVHTSPDELEWFKDNRDAARRAERRQEELRTVCSLADVVCSVGPRLQRKLGGLLEDGFGGRAILRVDPGIAEVSLATARRRTVPPDCTCLVLGRADDFQIKGLDIAARAFGLIHDGVRAVARPTLLIRGATQGEGEALHEQLTRIGGLHRGDLVVREYAADPQVVRGDLVRASVLLMPSRADGFGLVGLEALSLGTPVLLSERSGLAELLLEQFGDDAEPFVVEVSDDLERDAPRWRDAIENVLTDRAAAIDQTRTLAERAAVTLTWEAAAHALCEAALGRGSTPAS